ncbi:hypothetical protein PQS31_01730 [Luteimonas sp BLCC-B24]|uniref:hypothetical protein n=1 Tax=Luteimonas sp. BLCC-B24 TaxID=3025317 RepID=UPI00234E2B20|nr:hypothetical protein [Luteimonas sp. BLCC-B24]MDC7805551.1 hypothetical protein [Luteimonas sp. BLCC-B24]
MDDRAFRIHFARVHLNECRARRHSHVNRDFYWRLFESAQNARRQAAAMRQQPAQGGLFQ